MSASDAARFRAQGYLFPVDALDPREVATACAWLAGFEERHTDVPPRARRELLRFKPHLLHPELDRIVRHPRILDAVEALIGPDIMVWASAFFIKDAHDPAFVSWHQDSITYGVEGGALVSAWIALTEVDPGNASMKFIAGSHRGGLVPHRFVADPDNMVSLGETIDAVDAGAAVGVALKAGQMSLHALDLMHASDANASDRRRIGYVVRYFEPSMRTRDGRASALLVRGVDRHGHFEPERPPVAADDPATIVAYQRAMDMRRARVLAGADG